MNNNNNKNNNQDDFVNLRVYRNTAAKVRDIADKEKRTIAIVTERLIQEALKTYQVDNYLPQNS